MTQCCAIAVALFGGYFMAANLIHHYASRMLNLAVEKNQILQLAGYSMVVIFCLRIILALMPDFQIIALLLQFYTVYIVWEGSARQLQINEADRLKFTLVSSVALLCSPVNIEWIFDKLTFFLNYSLILIMKQPPVNIKNKRATFDYALIDTYTAGIVLTGTEIKSVRLGKASLVDTFCYFVKGELWVKNMHIAEYFYGSYNNHSARRDRKLLLNRKELDKLQRESKDPGFTIVPVRMFINEKGLCKVVVALAKGKKEYDKRESLKEKADKREMARMFKK